MSGLQAQRLGSSLRTKIELFLGLAVRRGIIRRERDSYNLECASIEDYSREWLVQQLCSVIGRTWHDRSDAIKATARSIGFRRTGARIQEAFKSAINSGIRRGLIERNEQSQIRKK